MKIVRTPTKAAGGITNDERTRMEAHTKMWIDRAYRTDPIDPGKIGPAIHNLYAAAGLPAPRVVIVPSPLVMAFAYGAAAAIWHARGATDVATAAAIVDVTYAATHVATYDATRNATPEAIRNATVEATATAIAAATDAATRNATRNVTTAATDAAIRNATDVATATAIAAATDAATRNATAEATRDAADAATRNATDVATATAIAAATDAATRNATRNVTTAATDAAIRNATRNATTAATDAATDAAIRNATRNVTTIAIHRATNVADAASVSNMLAGRRGLLCAVRWNAVYQGGNMWAAYDCYLTAMRDIIGLRLPSHDVYDAWEQAAIHGGFRVMHPQFCMVSDFPEVIRVDAENRPHCEDGPSHRWRDGWSLYHWHGQKVPDHWIEDRHNLTAAEVLREQNVEVRRAGCELLGWSKILSDLKAKIIDRDNDPEIGELVEVMLPDLPTPARFLRVKCGTGRLFAVGIPPHINTALSAQAWMIGLEMKNFTRPEVRT